MPLQSRRFSATQCWRGTVDPVCDARSTAASMRGQCWPMVLSMLARCWPMSSECEVLDAYLMI